MTKHCLECAANGKMARFKNEAFAITHAGMKVNVSGLSGWRCDSCKEIEFDAPSAKRYAAAGDELVLRERAAQAAELRRIRKRLGLNQQTAARLTGGGHNAFSRYETGKAAPLPAVLNLFKLLDKHPELLKELGA
jgi:HTH-type transcriptional regulator / antitoxin MqsA